MGAGATTSTLGTAEGVDGRLLVVLPLKDRRATQVELAGGKAAALARAAAAGLPVLPGFVVTTAAGAAIGAARGGRLPAEVLGELHTAWRALAAGGRPLVVRSSSVVEDARVSSMAGQFDSVLDVRGWEGFEDALRRVLASAARPGGRPASAAGMAVLVQPFLEPALGGVLFGADPVTGRTDRLLLATIQGGPHPLVSGTADGEQYTLSSWGRLLGGPAGSREATPSAHQRVALARLAHHAARLFGRPQDIEWALDRDGELWLLQSRPITAAGDAARARGPVFGPGPLAETFPDPLAPLEQDLWVDPLREAMRTVLPLTGAAPRRRVLHSPLVITVGGRVAVDLALLGTPVGRRSPLAFLDPRGPARHLLTAWRVGRLRAALPRLAWALVRRMDRHLAAVPRLRTLDDAALLRILDHAWQALVSLHGHEMLCGLLLRGDTTTVTGASAALRLLDAARRDGCGDAEIVARHPAVLVLLAPKVLPARPLPQVRAVPPPPERAGDDLALAREALRVRLRWVQELGARAAWELGERLAAAGLLTEPAAVAELRHEQLERLVRGQPAERDGGPAAVTPARRVRGPSPPLPVAFRLTADGTVVPVSLDPAGRDGVRGAGGGRGMGRVHGGPGDPEDGAVLVVRTLDPGLAASLPGLGGLVAETGSVLSHLAILAREAGVPTVVGVQGALKRFPPGAMVLVDGDSGEVTLLDPEREDAA